MTGITSGGGGGYDYVEPVYPSDPDEGESLYQTEENRAFVYNGSAWVEQTVTAHSQLSGVGPDTHHPQDHGNEDHTETYETEGGAQSRADSAEAAAEDYADGEIESHRKNETHAHPQPAENHGNEDHTATFETESGAQSRVDNHEADANAHHAVFEPSDYTPESDTHDRYTDSEAAAAAPLQRAEHSRNTGSDERPENYTSPGTSDSVIYSMTPVPLKSMAASVNFYSKGDYVTITLESIDRRDAFGQWQTIMNSPETYSGGNSGTLITIQNFNVSGLKPYTTTALRFNFSNDSGSGGDAGISVEITGGSELVPE